MGILYISCISRNRCSN